MSKRWITIDDFIDVYAKARQRGAGFIFSKLNTKGTSRTKSAFSDSFIKSSNWWIIPRVQERWNTLISGNPHTEYESYLMDTLFKDTTNLRALSLGSGLSTHEITLAQYSNFKEIVCLDIAQNRLQQAKKNSDVLGLTNIQFVCQSIYDFDFTKGDFDIVLFNASLHHFKEVEALLLEKVLPALKPKGYLVINEYVGPNRLQFPKNQIKAVNHALQHIPKEYRSRFKMKMKKHRFYGSGYLRMILADPSECVDAASIMPAIHKHFVTCVEKPYGGNILMNVLKDISHHFVELDKEKEAILDKLFALEDTFLKTNASDFIFGVYQKKD